MPPTLLCVQFQNLLPTEEVLLFARALWEAAQREGLSPGGDGDATLRIRKRESNVEPYEASLAHGSLQSTATGLDPLATIQAAFAQLGGAPSARRPPPWTALSTPHVLAERHMWQPKFSRG